MEKDVLQRNVEPIRNRWNYLLDRYKAAVARKNHTGGGDGDADRNKNSEDKEDGEKGESDESKPVKLDAIDQFIQGPFLPDLKLREYIIH